MRKLLRTSLMAAIAITFLLFAAQVLCGEFIRPALMELAAPAKAVGGVAERVATVPITAGRVGVGALMELAELAVICVFAIPIIAILGGVLLAAIRMFRSNPLDNAAEDTRLIQEIYHGLQRMEQRVEALETILLEKERKEK